MKFTSYLVLFCTKLEIFMLHKKKMNMINVLAVVVVLLVITTKLLNDTQLL
jgi:hypothetical protein